MRAPEEIRMPLPREESPTGITIFVRGLSIATVIGVPALERARPQTLLMDLEIELGPSRAGPSDRLADTVDYAAVVEDLRECLAQKRYFLLERLAEFVAERILARYGAVRVGVRIAKVGILKDVGSVGVSLERRRAASAATASSPRRAAASRLTSVKKK
jgi:dihydroneopterin aldolase